VVAEVGVGPVPALDPQAGQSGACEGDAEQAALTEHRAEQVRAVEPAVREVGEVMLRAGEAGVAQIAADEGTAVRPDVGEVGPFEAADLEAPPLQLLLACQVGAVVGDALLHLGRARHAKPLTQAVNIDDVLIATQRRARGGAN
jgi:hypothetical protein